MQHPTSFPKQDRRAKHENDGKNIPRPIWFFDHWWWCNQVENAEKTTKTMGGGVTGSKMVKILWVVV